jgi:hypothetical protein
MQLFRCGQRPCRWFLKHIAPAASGLMGRKSYLDDLSKLEANTVEGQPVFLFPDKGGFYFLSLTRGATPYPKLFDWGFSTDAHIADAIRQLASRCPAVGIWHGTRLLSFGAVLPPRLTMKPLEEALRRDLRRGRGVFEWGDGSVPKVLGMWTVKRAAARFGGSAERLHRCPQPSGPATR